MYITHLAALSLSSADNVHTQPPLKAPETRGGYDTDTHRNSRSFGKAFGGGGGAGRSGNSGGCSTQ